MLLWEKLTIFGIVHLQWSIHTSLHNESKDFLMFHLYFYSQTKQNQIHTPGLRLMGIHLVRNSTSAKFQKNPNLHLVRPIIHLAQIFELTH